MSDPSLPISTKAASELIELALGGLMTEATFMELFHQLVRPSSSNVKIISDSTSAVGLLNSWKKSGTLEETSAASSTRNAEPPTQKTNTPLSHSECWCSYSKKRGTRSAKHR